MRSARTGDATALPWEAAAFDFTISDLVLNFVPDHEAMVKEMVRVTRPGGTVAAYVWDYAGKMEMMRLRFPRFFGILRIIGNRFCASRGRPQLIWLRLTMTFADVSERH